MTAIALAACGPATASGGGGARPVGRRRPRPVARAPGAPGSAAAGVNGLIAAVNGSTMQVQTRTDQTAVSWNDARRSHGRTAALSDVTVGTCVTVLEPPASGTPTGSATSSPATQVTAASVEVRPATNGECAGGFGGWRRCRRTGGATRLGAPTGRPRTERVAAVARTSARRAVAGLVTAVSGDTITVQETMRARGDGTASTRDHITHDGDGDRHDHIFDDLHRTEGRRAADVAVG